MGDRDRLDRKHAAQPNVEAIDGLARADDEAAERVERQAEERAAREHAVLDLGPVGTNSVDGARPATASTT